VVITKTVSYNEISITKTCYKGDTVTIYQIVGDETNINKI